LKRAEGRRNPTDMACLAPPQRLPQTMVEGWVSPQVRPNLPGWPHKIRRQSVGCRAFTQPTSLQPRPDHPASLPPHGSPDRFSRPRFIKIDNGQACFKLSSHPFSSHQNCPLTFTTPYAARLCPPVHHLIFSLIYLITSSYPSKCLDIRNAGLNVRPYIKPNTR
jgi:hypothetical protein